MVSAAAAGLLGQARQFLGLGDVASALAACEGALQAGGSAEGHHLAGGLRYLDDDLVRARGHWESAFDLYERAGERRPAARVAAALADLHAAGLGNLAAGRGWVQRGRRVLAPEGRCVEVGYLELGLVACLYSDVEAVERSADLALTLAVEFHDRDLEVRALADGGLALVSQGRSVEGFDRVDEALAAMSAGQVHDPVVLGKSMCSLLSACDRAGDLRRAEECLQVVLAMISSRLGDRPRVLHTHCRSSYGSVLCGLGRWSEGERVLTDALGPTSSVSSYHRMMTSCHLADLRILQGRLDEASSLLRPWHERVDAFCPRARLHLAANEYDVAASLARAGLTALRGDALRAVPLWSVLVSAEVARTDLPAARAAAQELAELVDRTPSPVLRAEALLAAGVVAAAAGDDASAVPLLQQAEAMVIEDPRPVLRARIGYALAQALAGAGQVELAIEEARAALENFLALDAGPDADRTAALLRRLGAPASRARSMDPTQLLAGLTAREQQVLQLLCEGLTNAQIGLRLFVTTKTVEHHVSRVLAKLGVHSRAQASALCVRARRAVTAQP
jgi:DNA-binding CsgD family transcriptional regulator/tetratricopeptide (TPR) repeat protein